jgi:NAD(P)-dependent dehydrogenase (short-subunit alcohol dehydrogenase family)
MSAPPVDAVLSVAVVGGPGGSAGQAAAGLRRLGAQVTELAPANRADLTAALSAIHSLDLVVWAPSPGASATPTPLMDQDEAQWDAGASQPLREAVACFQAAEQVLVGSASSTGDNGGSAGAIVAILPTIAMNGSSGLTAWCTASEGLRSLVKVASREFSKRGITVNAVTLPAAVLAGSAESLNRPGLPPAQLPIPEDAGDVAGILAALAAAPWTSVTGATIAVDGGVWVPA